ncbi:MAG: Holliday junction branch migration protein RuvA [Kiritimatiellae bacterium]|nr:Holliday junction branch migration protein RuvA [Kiritimatiellia bacterium]MDW8458281.1 Holliday junction branch migration protein RuvA [Verrucomicrobiota bacterium]
MISFLQGVLEEKQPGRIVVNVGGVGYEAWIPLSSYDRLPPEGASCKVLTVLHIREDAHELYAFAAEEERRIFRLLCTVAGVGPKTALGVLGGLSVREIKAAIAEQDVRRLASVKGIGRKTAEKIIVELKDKLTEGEMLEAVSGAATPSAEDLRARDAVLALVSLGYKQAEALAMVRAALSESGPAATVEDLVRKALSRAS